MGGQKSGTPWRPPLQMCTSSFMSALIASFSAPLEHPYPFQHLFNIAYCHTTAIVPSGMVEHTCFQASSHSTRGEGGAQFLPLGGGGGLLQRWGGVPQWKVTFAIRGGVGTTHSASVFMTCSSKGLHLQTGGGGLGRFTLTVHLAQQQGVQAPPASAHHGSTALLCSALALCSTVESACCAINLPQMFFPPNDTQCHH